MCNYGKIQCTQMIKNQENGSIERAKQKEN